MPKLKVRLLQQQAAFIECKDEWHAARGGVGSGKTLGAVFTDNPRLQAQCAAVVLPPLCVLARDDQAPVPLLAAAVCAGLISAFTSKGYATSETVERTLNLPVLASAPARLA